MDALLTSLPSHLPFASPTDPVAEANHRIANSLALLASLVRMQGALAKKRSAPYSGAEVCQLLAGVAARIGTISQVHRILSREQADGVVHLQPHLKEITDALVTALSSSEQQVRVVH